MATNKSLAYTTTYDALKTSYGKDQEFYREFNKEFYGSSFAIAGGLLGLIGGASGASAGASLGNLIGRLANSGNTGHAIADFFGYETYSNLKSAVTKQQLYRDASAESAKAYMRQRNSTIASAKRNIAETRSSFGMTYGDDTYSKLESQLNKILNMSSGEGLESMLTSLNYEKNAESLVTRLLGTDEASGKMSSDDLQTLLGTSFSLKDFGTAYIDNLVELIGKNEDSEMSASLNALGINQHYQQDMYDSEMQSIGSQYAQQFAEAFLGYRNENISNVMSIGSVQAQEGSSGLKSGGKSSIVQAFQNDLSKASYAITMNYLINMSKNSLDSRNLSYQQSMYEIEQQRKQYNTQIKNSLNNSIMQMYEGKVETVQSIIGGESAIDEKRKEAEDINSAVNDFLNDNKDEGKLITSNTFDRTSAYTTTSYEFA